MNLFVKEIKHYNMEIFIEIAIFYFSLIICPIRLFSEFISRILIVIQNIKMRCNYLISLIETKQFYSVNNLYIEFEYVYIIIIIFEYIYLNVYNIRIYTHREIF